MTDKKTNQLTMEEHISLYLEEDAQKAVLDFIMYLQEINMPLRCTKSAGWIAGSGKKGVCKLGVFKEHAWEICLSLNHRDQYEELIFEKGWQDTFWDNASYCVHRFREGKTGVGCNPNKGCAGGENRTILGREFGGICHNTDVCALKIRNPDETEIEIIKGLMELEQGARVKDKAAGKTKS